MTARSHLKYFVPASTDPRKMVPAEKFNIIDSQMQIWMKSACRNSGDSH